MGNRLINTVFLSNISIKEKTTVERGGLTPTIETELIPARLFEQQPPRLFGKDKIGIMDSKVKDYARTLYKPEGSNMRPNRLRIDCLVKESKIFNDLNFKAKDLEIVDILLKSYEGNTRLGVNQLFIILDEINQKGNGMSINFIGGGRGKFGDIVYNILSRLSIYKTDYWSINLLTMKLSHLEYILEQDDCDRIVKLLSHIPNVSIIGDRINSVETFTANIRNSKLELKVLLLLKDGNKTSDTYSMALINNIRCGLVVAESTIIDVLPSTQKYIELVTSGNPTKPVVGLPFPLHYSSDNIRNIVRDGHTSKILLSGGREIILRTPVDKPVIILTNVGDNNGTRMIRTKHYNTLVLENVTDLPFIITSRLSELLK